MATGITEQRKESLVKKELSCFLRSQGLEGSIESIDEIVLTYVISILEDLGDNSNAEENIDVDQFVEMMEAYIPGFSSINSVQVCEWMFELSSLMSKDQTGEVISQEPDSKPSSTDENSNPGPEHTYQRQTSEDERNQNSQETEDQVDECVRMLLEMFPAACTQEVSHCLDRSQGDIEEAAQLILDRQENGLSITPKVPKGKGKSRRDIKLLEDPNLKEMVVQRYGYQDTDEDKKTFKPVIPKTESKKLIRYLDSRVVSTKGEKFTEIKKDDDEDMKKTYVNLKPARKYRFH